MTGNREQVTGFSHQPPGKWSDDARQSIRWLWVAHAFVGVDPFMWTLSGFRGCVGGWIPPINFGPFDENP